MLQAHNTPIEKRFRGYLPIVVDVETAGFDASTDALLEIAALSIVQNEDYSYSPGTLLHYHIKPFDGSIIYEECLKFNKIDPSHPFRYAVTEKEALTDLFSFLNKLKKSHNCTKCVLVGHNAWFDLSFINAATKRCKIKKSPFHSFTSIDTASLAAIFYGHTVLAQVCKEAKIHFDASKSHSAIYDTEKTAELFCKILNQQNEITKNNK